MSPGRTPSRVCAACRLTLFLISTIVVVATICSVLSVAPAFAEQTRQVYRLNYTDSGISLEIPMVLERREVIFKKEHDFGRRNIVRGALPTGPNEGDFIGFAWDEAERRLYLDLNQNLDLTDDPGGTYEAGADSYYHDFEHVRLKRIYDGATIPYVIDMEFYSERYVETTVNSGWRGEIELNGERWPVAVADNLDGRFGKGDTLILGTFHCSFVPRILMFDDARYDLDFAFEPGEGQPDLILTFAPSQSPLGELTLNGRFVNRLVLKESDDGASLVILNSPSGTAQMPTGEYVVEEVYLKDETTGRSFEADTRARVFITQEKADTLTIGGPLRHKLTVNRWGNALVLSYLLVGAGGESYTDPQQESSKAPGFAIYKGDTRIASGSFEYG